MTLLSIVAVAAYGLALVWDIRTTLKGIALGAREISPVYGTKGGRVRWWLVCVIEGALLAAVSAGLAHGELWSDLAALGILGFGGIRHYMAALSNRAIVRGLTRNA